MLKFFDGLVLPWSFLELEPVWLCTQKPSHEQDPSWCEHQTWREGERERERERENDGDREKENDKDRERESKRGGKRELTKGIGGCWRELLGRQWLSSISPLPPQHQWWSVAIATMMHPADLADCRSQLSWTKLRQILETATPYPQDLHSDGKMANNGLMTQQTSLGPHAWSVLIREVFLFQKYICLP